MSEMNENTKAKYSKPPVSRGVLQRFPRAIMELARVSEFGAKKHGVSITDDSFALIPDAAGVFDDAEVRHILKEAIEGPVNEEDGGLLHVAQRAWDALAYLEIILREREQGKAVSFDSISGVGTVARDFDVVS